MQNFLDDIGCLVVINKVCRVLPIKGFDGLTTLLALIFKIKFTKLFYVVLMKTFFRKPRDSLKVSLNDSL